MTSADLTVRILEEIREEIRGLRAEQRADRDEHRADRQEQRQSLGEFREIVTARFEVIETTLRDLAEQLVMLARGVKVAIDQRGGTDTRLDDHERRTSEIEKRIGG